MTWKDGRVALPSSGSTRLGRKQRDSKRSAVGSEGSGVALLGQENENNGGIVFLWVVIYT